MKPPLSPMMGKSVSGNDDGGCAATGTASISIAMSHRMSVFPNGGVEIAPI